MVYGATVLMPSFSVGQVLDCREQCALKCAFCPLRLSKPILIKFSYFFPTEELDT